MKVYLGCEYVIGKSINEFNFKNYCKSLFLFLLNIFDGFSLKIIIFFLCDWVMVRYENFEIRFVWV